MTVTLEIPVDESWDPHWVVWPDLLVNPSGLDVKPDLTVNPSDLFVKPDLIVNPSDLVVKPDLNVNPSGLVVKPDLIVNPSDLVIEPDLIIKLLDPGVSMSQVLDREVSSGTEIVAGRNFELSEWRNTVADVDGLDEGGHPVLEIGESVAKVLVRLSCLETSIKTIVLWDSIWPTLHCQQYFESKRDFFPVKKLQLLRWFETETETFQNFSFHLSFVLFVPKVSWFSVSRFWSWSWQILRESSTRKGFTSGSQETSETPRTI